MTKRVLIVPLNNLKKNKDVTMLCVRPFPIASAYTQNVYMYAQRQYTSVTDENFRYGTRCFMRFPLIILSKWTRM